MEFSESQAALCQELNISLTDVNAGQNSLFTITEINQFINDAVKRAWDYKPWTFTEGVVSLTFPGTPTASYAYPVSFEDESMFMVIVNGVPWKGEGSGKRNFEDYMKWLSDYPSDKSLIWTEYARSYYLNQNAYLAGQSYSVYGKLRAPTLSGSTDLLPFSPTTDAQENSGNHAIILLAFADVLASAKKKDPAGSKAQEARALLMLDTVWKPMGERKAQKNSENRPFFNTDDYFAGRRTPFNTNIGNFP